MEQFIVYKQTNTLTAVDTLIRYDTFYLLITHRHEYDRKLLQLH